ncbi:hypothetical protein LXL04_034378 [Taraxacum kok-saghyz]
MFSNSGSVHIIWYQSNTILISDMVSNTDRIATLENDVGKMRQEAEASRIEVGMQLREMMKAISDLTLAVGKKDSRKNGDLGVKEPKFGFFDDDDESVGSKKNNRFDGKERDPLSEVRKLKAPVFDGEEPYGWIYRVERYFEIHGIKGRDQLRAAAICMDRAALAWYR